MIANKPSTVKKYFATLVGEGDVMTTYEAGCFGYSLYRQLTEMGVNHLELITNRQCRQQGRSPAHRRIRAVRGRQAPAEHIGLRYPIRRRFPCVYQPRTIVVDPFSLLSFLYR